MLLFAAVIVIAVIITDRKSLKWQMQISIYLHLQEFSVFLQ